MRQEDLSAFIPTNKNDAVDIGWERLPNDSLIEALVEKCLTRVIRAEAPWLASYPSKAPFKTPSGSIVTMKHNRGLWVELEIA